MTNTIKIILGIIIAIIATVVVAGVYRFNFTNDDIYVSHSGMVMKYDDAQDEAMREHCKTMPSMPGCEAYIEDKSSTLSGTSFDKEELGTGKHTMNHGDMIQSEFEFLTLMIPHHQEAVDTTQQLLNVTQNADLIKLGQGIVNGQTAEVTMMKSWLSKQYPEITYQGMGYMPMMRSTTNLTVEQIDKQWTEDMIGHHQGALDMANKLLKIMDTKDPLIKATGEQLEFRTSLREFANNIIINQQKEIDQMKSILTK